MESKIDERSKSIEEMLRRLSKKYPDMARLAKKLIYERMSLEAAAACCQIDVITAKRNWQFARAWLLSELKREKRTREDRG